MLIDQLRTDPESLRLDRKYVVDTRYQRVRELLKEDFLSAFSEYSDLFQMVFRLSGSLFWVNDFTYNYIKQLRSLLAEITTQVEKRSDIEQKYVVLLHLFENYLLFLEMLREEKGQETYDRFKSYLTSFKTEIEETLADTSNGIKTELDLYIGFLDIGLEMTLQNEFTQFYYDKVRILVDKTVKFIRSDPEVIAPVFLSNIAINMGGVLMESDLETSKEVLDYAREIAAANGASAMMARSHIMLAHNYRLNGLLDVALEHYQKSMEMADIPLVMLNYPVRHIGQILQTRGELRTALLYYQKSLDLFTFVENHLAVARTLQYIGNIHYMLASHTKALEYYEDAYRILVEQKYQRMVAEILYSKIRVDLDRSKLGSARNLLEELGRINGQMEHEGISQVYRLCKAMVLKSEPRRVKKARSQEILEDLLEAGFANHEYSIVAMQQLCELLVDEMRSEFAEEIFEEATDLVDRLLSIGMEQQLYQVQIQALILQSQFDMVQGNFDATLSRLSEAEEMCQSKDLPQLTQYVVSFRERYQSELSKWQAIVLQNESLEDRLANPQIQEYIRVTLSSVQEEMQQAEALLKNVLPEEIIPHLHYRSEIYAERFHKVSILFADIVGFTSISEKLDPRDMVLLLNEVFSNFDRFLPKYDVEKIRTIGDNYMVVVGAPRRNAEPTKMIARFALDISQYLVENRTKLHGISFRMGINTGEVVAGVVGTDKYNFDVWGDAVNVAARMESHGVPRRIQVTELVYEELREEFELEERGVIEIKGKKPMKTWFLLSEKKQ